ncbi:MAG: hypothetical protein ACRCZS_08885 [Chroococcidiopsis sp.]
MTSNITRLISHIASLDAIPTGGGIQDGLDFLADPNLANRLNVAKVKANTYIDAILATHDNPYGDDREKVAGVILERIAQKQLGDRS